MAKHGRLFNTSTIKVNNIIESTAGGGTFSLPRVWVNFNGEGVVSVRGSFNVSSVTDLFTGCYGVNFATSFSSGNYSAVSTAGGNLTNYTAQNNDQDHNSFNGITSTGNVPVFSVDHDGGEQDDAAYMHVTCCGDQ